ncbi:MAG TPA: SH3 domain-containing protein, partial [Gammaproteobacteria bacterium]|nr:SH3 domain-containing protein [Gammaproteobacteria bacterium]
IQAAVLNVRAGPGLEFTVIARVERGVSLAVFGSGPGWYYVRLPDGQYGWVMTQYTIPVNLEPAG